MRPQDFFDLLRRRPFVPFRIFATDGRTFDVRHPDQALVLKTRVILPLPGGSDDVAERSEHLALVHVVRLGACSRTAAVDRRDELTRAASNHGWTASFTSRWNSSRSFNRSDG